MYVPQIRYIEVDDGVSIAYAVFGSGPPLFYAFAGPGLSFFDFEWKNPALVEQYEVIARERTVVRFDWRNSGLSSRGVEDVAPVAHLRDLLALQDHLGYQRISLRIHGSARTGIRYAATHPDRVSSLILSSPSVTAADPNRLPTVTQRFTTIAAETDWRLFARVFAVSLAGWDSPETSWFAKLIETGVRPSDFYRTVAQANADDVSGLVRNVRCPVLVIQRREPPNYFYDTLDPEAHLADSRMLMRELRNARLALLEGSTMMISSDPAATSCLLEFLRSVDADATPTGADAASPIRLIFFTDLVGHTEMMQRLGDAKGREVLREHERIMREALARHSGGEIKTMGDGFMASFNSTQHALECAVALQRAFEDRDGEPLSVRIGINAGEPIVEESDLFGSSVIAAARIAAHARGRQVLVSDVVRQLVTGKGFRFEDLGETVLKGMDEKVRIWELDWRLETSPPTPS